MNAEEHAAEIDAVPCTRPQGHLGTCVHQRPSPQGDLCGLTIAIRPGEYRVIPPDDADDA